MYSEFNRFSFMGVSEKDLNVVEFNFLVRPTSEIFQDECHVVLRPEQEVQQQHDEQEQREHHEKESECEILVSSLDIKLPVEFEVEDDEDGFKTPTSSDRKIPVIFQCPPAPRKPRFIPSTKRKVHHRKILLDLSNEIESFFPPLSDLGGKIPKSKKVK